MNINNIRDILNTFTREIILSQYSILISGSFHFHNGGKRFLDGRSDIDIIVIIGRDKHTLDSLKRIYPKHIVADYSLYKIEVLNYSIKYGIGRNSLNIKFISLDLYHKIINLKSLNFYSYRLDNTLSKKKSKTFFYTSSLILEKIQFIYQEYPIIDGVILKYNLNQEKYNNIVIMSDLLSMIIYSHILTNKLNIKKINTIDELAKYHNIKLNNLEKENLNRYHINKGNLSL